MMINLQIISLTNELNWLEYTLYNKYQCLVIQFNEKSTVEQILNTKEGEMNIFLELMKIEDWFFENNKNFYIKEISDRSVGSAFKESESLGLKELLARTQDLLDNSDT